MRLTHIDLQLFATGTVQNYVRNAVSAARVATVDLTVTNPQGTASTSNPTFSSGAGVIYAGDLVYITGNNALASLSSADPTVSTTSLTAVTAVNAAGTAVTPVTMNNILVGHQLVVDTGTQAETVTVTSVTGTTFTATYTKTHASGFAIKDRLLSFQSTTSAIAGSTQITIGAHSLTVNSWVLVDGAGQAEICQITAVTGTQITITTIDAHAQPYQVDTLPVNTLGNTNVGSQTIIVASATNIKVGSALLIDTLGSGVQETVTVTAITGTSVTANFQNAHSGAGYPVANAKANSNAATFAGVAVDTYPIVFTQGVSGPFPAGTPQKIQYRRDGEWRFHTTNGDTLVIGQAVYLGADGQTVQATALGRSIGTVASDQRPVGVQLGVAVTGAAGQDVIIAINPAIFG
jgi:hypothetical protein